MAEYPTPSTMAAVEVDPVAEADLAAHAAARAAHGLPDPAGLPAGRGLLWDGAAWTTPDLATQAELDTHAADTLDVHGVADMTRLARVDQTFGGKPWTPGRWYAYAGGSGSGAPANLDLRCSPWPIPNGQAFDSIGFQVVTGGEAGSLIDLLLYADSGNTYPGALIQSWLGIDAATAGGKQCDLPVPIVSAGLYWVAVRLYNSPVTRPVIRWNNSPQLGLSIAGASAITLMLGAAFAGYVITGQNTNPDPFPVANVAPPSNCFRAVIRAA